MSCLVTDIKKSFKAFVVTAMLLLCSAIPVLAATDDIIPEPDPSTRTDITVNITSPEVYQGDIEFYCNTETFYITVKSGETLTSATFNVPKGSYKIGFLDANDIANSFTITYNDFLDTDKQSSVEAVIDYSDDLENYDGSDVEGDDGVEDISVSPAVYDLSEGKEYGTIVINCTQYGSIDSVVYKLMGTNRVYDITLDAEHGFSANVYLPAGTYKELTSIDVTPNELATITSDLTFAWGHRNSTYYGNNYDVTVGSSTSIDDLYIKMNYQGDLREVDDLILMQTKIRNDYTELVKEKREEFIESELSDTHPTIAEPETSAPVIAEATETHNNNTLKYICIGVGCLFVLCTIAVIVKRKRSSEADDSEA